MIFALQFLPLIFSFSCPFVPTVDDFSSQDNLDEPEAGGWDATLTAEDEDEFFELQIVKHHESEVGQSMESRLSTAANIESLQ